MLIDFDPAKDALNRAKHGVSLAMARELDWDAALGGKTIDSATTSSA